VFGRKEKHPRKAKSRIAGGTLLPSSTRKYTNIINLLDMRWHLNVKRDKSNVFDRKEISPGSVPIVYSPPVGLFLWGRKRQTIRQTYRHK
jgi:hypothetical protein